MKILQKFFFFLFMTVKKILHIIINNTLKKLQQFLIQKKNPSNYQEGIMAMIDHPSCYNSETKNTLKI